MNRLLRIALVEDDDDLRLTTEEYLSVAGFTVWGAGSAEEFYRKFIAQPVDIAILDVGLPGDDGLKVASLLQLNRGVDVIILSARDATEDRLAGFRAGADRYLVKPVNLAELVANIEALAKRRDRIGEHVSGSASLGDKGEEPITGWRLDATDWCLHAPSGKRLTLTAREFVLLRCLVKAEGLVVTKKVLCSELFGPRILTASDRLNVLVARLRKKAQASLSEELPLKTVHQLGYAFSAACTFSAT